MNEPLKLTPLYATALKLGARFVDVAQWHFPEAYSDTQAEIAACRAGCGLADVTPHGKLQIEGAPAAEALRAVYGQAPEAVGAGLSTPDGHLYCLRPDLFYLSTPPGQEAGALARLTAASAGLLVTVTDMTHALADLRLIGPASANVLSMVCGLDFRDAAFPDMTAKYSSVARTRQLIARRDFGPLPAYTLAGDQSLAAYLWEILMEAGQEVGIKPVGVRALKALEG